MRVTNVDKTLGPDWELITVEETTGWLFKKTETFRVMLEKRFTVTWPGDRETSSMYCAQTGKRIPMDLTRGIESALRVYEWRRVK